MARIYPDSKTFVDMKLKAAPEVTIEKFKEWRQANPGDLSKDVVRQFVEVSFRFEMQCYTGASLRVGSRESVATPEFRKIFKLNENVIMSRKTKRKHFRNL